MQRIFLLSLALTLLAFGGAAADEPVDDMGGYAPNAEDFKDRGIAADAAGKYTEAINNFDKSLEENPNDGTVWHYKAQTYKKMGKYKEAVECYEKTIEFYDTVIASNPYDGESWWMKGNALKKLGKYGRAKDCFENAKEYGYEGEDE